MKNINVRSLILTILIFSVSNFVVHKIFNPELPILESVGYAIFSGIIFGTTLYLFERKTNSLK
jgi:hypothetical protein